MASCSAACSAPSTSAQCVDRARPRAGSRRSTNTGVYLSRRSAGIFSKDAGTLLRQNVKMLRQIILQESRVFKKVWTRHSKTPIFYESGRIYFENYRCCFSSIPSRPQHLYLLPKPSKLEKIEDALLCQCPLDNVLSNPSDQTPCLLALTAHNWLYRLSTKTGEQLQKVCISSHYKFRYLGWDVPQETFYVKSVQNKQSPAARQAGVDNTMIYMAVFQVFPLEIVAVLDISKKVFGNTVVDVTLSQGVLIVSHSTKTVKLYSFETIVNKFMTRRLALGEYCEWNGISGMVGESPFGIPVNIYLNDSPPVLYELSCLDNNIQIGGHPWHVIFTPNHKKHRGTYHISSLKDGSLAHNGIQDMQCCSLESDWIYFHPDDSGRIIHVGPSKINVLKIVKSQEHLLKYGIAVDFSIMAHRDYSSNIQCDVTSSGRTVKKRFHQLDDDPEKETFRDVVYEDELDLLAVVEVTLRDEKGKANVGLHDNQSGALMKMVELVESWDVTYTHELFFDQDTIVHIAQEKSNHFFCHVYKISGGQTD